APVAVELRPQWTPKGKPQPTRPARATRVTLPNGLPEPSTYPPSKNWLDKVEKMRAAGEAPKQHPLWAFFHVPPESMEVTADTKMPPDFGSLPRLENESAELKSGRSWSAPELRLKSFEDLHTLWYILLRERNVIATQKAERKRIRIAQQYGGKLLSVRSLRCRKSMARIKYVLNERRLGAIAAAAPSVHADAAQRVSVPFALKGLNDPASQVEALAGVTP
ncbi:MRP-L47-domain-containing protein, partial [Cutaneotrichosporon oleaginosum]